MTPAPSTAGQVFDPPRPDAGPRRAAYGGDFNRSPLIVFYELTRACDLVCQHCRACAQPARHPHELSTAQAKALLYQLAAFPRPPLLVLTGGDPFKRDDLEVLIAAAREAGLQVALTPSATPLATREAMTRVQQAGVRRMALSLDAADPATHDAFRGVSGSFDRTLAMAAWAKEARMPLQINTTVGPHNFDQIDALADLLAGLGIVLWSVFFLVPVGRGRLLPRLDAQQCEQVFARLWHHSRRQPYAIKTTEAPHYRRFVLQQLAASDAAGGDSPPLWSTAGTNDGKGVVFISHTGQIFPSGFLPIDCGRFPRDSVVEIYQNHPVFQALRDPDRLKGKCGVCEFRVICGGSRARAYAVHRDPLAPEPDCVHQPQAWTEQETPCSA